MGGWGELGARERMLYDACSVRYLHLTGQAAALEAFGMCECACCGQWKHVQRSNGRAALQCGR